MTKEAILIVDAQYDFFPGGALGVAGGDEIIEPINSLIARKQVPVFISQDWHPENTVHFEKNGGTWPVHCVENTRGSEIHEDLNVEPEAGVKKGTDPEDDGGYSAFDGKDPEGQTLKELLDTRGITHLIVCGLATDYCVRHTVLDALKYGYAVELYTDGVRPVNLSPEDGIKAVADMMEAGATLLTWADLD